MFSNVLKFLFLFKIVQEKVFKNLPASEGIPPNGPSGIGNAPIENDTSRSLL